MPKNASVGTCNQKALNRLTTGINRLISFFLLLYFIIFFRNLNFCLNVFLFQFHLQVALPTSSRWPELYFSIGLSRFCRPGRHIHIHIYVQNRLIPYNINVAVSKPCWFLSFCFSDVQTYFFSLTSFLFHSTKLSICGSKYVGA